MLFYFILFFANKVILFYFLLIRKDTISRKHDQSEL